MKPPYSPPTVGWLLRHNDTIQMGENSFCVDCLMYIDGETHVCGSRWCREDGHEYLLGLYAVPVEAVLKALPYCTITREEDCNDQSDLRR